MRRGLSLLAFVFIVNGSLVHVGLTQTPQGTPDPLAADGKKVFQATCASQYCHGPGGKGGQGPRLIEHTMPPDYVSATVREGRPGTNMAPFKNILDSAEINAVIAYVLSLSPPAAASPTLMSPSEPSAVPVSVGRERGVPAAGAEVFFDATRLSSCRACHSYDKRGGPLGVDFAGAHKTPEEILASITAPRIASPAYPVIAVTTDGGEKLIGVRGIESADRVQLFDLVVPPVRRNLKKSKIVDIQVSDKGIFDHTKLGLTRQQLLDVAAFLGSREP